MNVSKWIKKNWWGLVIFFFIVGFALILYGSKLDENLNAGLYRTSFKIDVLNLNKSVYTFLPLDDWTFFYDFSKNKGDISFRLRDPGVWNLSSVAIEFPKEIKNKSLEVWSIKEGNRKKIILKDNPQINIVPGDSDIPSSSAIYINFKENFTDEKLIIKFKFKNKLFINDGLKPKGRFQFYKQENVSLGPNMGFETHNGNVHLILGKRYGCLENCVEPSYGIKENVYSTDEDIKLNFEMNTASEIRLNAYSKNSLFWKDFFIAVGISLIVTSLSLFLSYFIPKNK